MTTLTSTTSHGPTLYVIGNLIGMGQTAKSIDGFETMFADINRQSLRDRFVIGEYIATASYDFLLLPVAPSVSCSCVRGRSKYTPRHKLPPSPAVSHFLHLVYFISLLPIHQPPTTPATNHQPPATIHSEHARLYVMTATGHQLVIASMPGVSRDSNNALVNATDCVDPIINQRYK